MQKDKIINELKAQYPRDLRKQLVKTILSNEKNDDKIATEKSYNLMNQIFSYVLKECNWSMTDNSKNWDNTPLEIMAEIFPKLGNTQWYKEQGLTAKKNIGVVLGQNK